LITQKHTILSLSPRATALPPLSGTEFIQIIQNILSNDERDANRTAASQPFQFEMSQEAAN